MPFHFILCMWLQYNVRGRTILYGSTIYFMWVNYNACLYDLFSLLLNFIFKKNKRLCVVILLVAFLNSDIYTDYLKYIEII